MSQRLSPRNNTWRSPHISKPFIELTMTVQWARVDIRCYSSSWSQAPLSVHFKTWWKNHNIRQETSLLFVSSYFTVPYQIHLNVSSLLSFFSLPRLHAFSLNRGIRRKSIAITPAQLSRLGPPLYFPPMAFASCSQLLLHNRWWTEQIWPGGGSSTITTIHGNSIGSLSTQTLQFTSNSHNSPRLGE